MISLGMRRLHLLMPPGRFALVSITSTEMLYWIVCFRGAAPPYYRNQQCPLWAESDLFSNS